jgi:hypothetical protein
MGLLKHLEGFNKPIFNKKSKLLITFLFIERLNYKISNSYNSHAGVSVVLNKMVSLNSANRRQ